MRIALIDNVSARAFEIARPAFPAELIPMSPTESYRALAEGDCDAGLLPAGCMPELRDRFKFIDSYGIACTGRVSSVRLFCARPLRTVLLEGAPVYVSEKSQTSRRLFAALCRAQFGMAPQLTASAECAEARLFIGEDALVPDVETATWPFVTDIGQWWLELTGLPFVYAVWVIRRDFSATQRASIEHWLQESSRFAGMTTGRLRMAERSAPYFTSAELAMDYYGRIRPRITQADRAGMAAYHRLIEETELCQLRA
jgi:chorismate dehydratase